VAKINDVTVKFTEAELAIVTEQALKLGMPIATYLRHRSLLPVGRWKQSLELKSEHRSRLVTVKFSDEELEILSKRIANLGIKRATYIRTRGLQSIKALKQSIERQRWEQEGNRALTAIEVELRRQGNNLNQIARGINHSNLENTTYQGCLKAVTRIETKLAEIKTQVEQLKR
jgi:predicted DNA binding CopG/RHH family protein